MKIPAQLPPVIRGIIVIVAFALGVVAGYMLRMNQEDVSSARVVLKDEKVVRKINAIVAEEKADVEARKKELESRTFDECLTAPLPFDFSVQSKNN